jgi:Fe-S-cluster containining protein
MEEGQLERFPSAMGMAKVLEITPVKVRDTTPCQCEKCVKLCTRNPGWFTPDEAQRAIATGLADQLMLDWLDEDERYDIQHTIWILSPASQNCWGEWHSKQKAPDWDDMHDDGVHWILGGQSWKGPCIFLKDNLCRIHNTDFKPLECRSGRYCIDGDADGSEHIAIGKLWDTDAARAIVADWKQKVGYVEDDDVT